MRVVQEQATAEALTAYASVSGRFQVTSRVDLASIESPTLSIEPLERAYGKDLDAGADQSPSRWPGLYDLGRWGIFIAYDSETPAGACAVATGTPSLYFATAPHEALLWDIRVAPGYRGRGAGTAMFEAVAKWARNQGFGALLIETQDTNLPACRFYKSRGCSVVQVRRGAYAEYPREALVVWRLDLAG